MIISCRDLMKKTYHHFSEDISFKEEDLKMIPLFSSLKFAHAEIEVRYLEQIIEVQIFLKAELMMLSTRTLKEILLPIESKDVYLFTSNTENLDEDMIYFDENEIDLYPCYLDLLLSSIPMKFVGDENDYPHGKGWEVISEDEYNKRKERNNPFSELLRKENEDEE